MSDQRGWKEIDPSGYQNGTKSPRRMGTQTQRLGKEIERERPEKLRSWKEEHDSTAQGTSKLPKLSEQTQKKS